MHDTAFEIGSKFLSLYGVGERKMIVEIGSQDVNGSLRASAPPEAVYIGVDLEHGKGVDVVTGTGNRSPLRSEFADLVLSSSQMEHDPRFWVTFLEFCRIVKPGGFIYINAPSNGYFHSFPLDVWRFYPDAARALAGWARENGFPLTLIESFTAYRMQDIWNDYIAVFYMGEWSADRPIQFLSDHFAGANIRKFGMEHFLNFIEESEDQQQSSALRGEVSALQERLRQEQARIRELEAELDVFRSQSDAPRMMESAPAPQDADALDL